MRVLFVVGALLLATSCTKKMESSLKTDKERLSYAIGQEIGQSLKTQQIEIDTPALVMSINDVLEKKDSRLSQEELQKVMMTFQESRREKAKADAEKNKTEGQAFLEKNKEAEGVKVTKSGLQYKVLSEGKGKSPKAKDTVSVHYTGKLLDGTEFDSSVKRGEPAQFPVEGVIPGWTEALQMMKEGDKWQLYIPAELAYGEMGRPGIPPNSVLTFEVELLKIVK